MKVVVITCSLLLSAGLFAQDINPQLEFKTWQDNETRNINGYAVTRIFGHVVHAPAAYNFIPLTAVGYKDLNQLKAELTKKAGENHWNDTLREQKMLALEKKAKGGELEIYISRFDEDYANFRWYFVIIRGADDKGKLWEKDLGYQAPEIPYERGWWNYTTIQIPVALKTPFYVYLNNKNTRYLCDFKFRIEKVLQNRKSVPELG